MFFDSFRAAVARLPAGLLRPGPPASEQAIAAARRALAAPVPDAYWRFLRSFDGVDLFHESIVVAGVDAAAARSLLDLSTRSGDGDGDDPAVTFAESIGGDRFVFDDQRVVRLRAGSDERWLTGSSFESWLAAVIAHDEILYGADGEFAHDVFEPGGRELLPRAALRQAERALRLDRGSAEWEHERGTALRRLGRTSEAAASFARAAELHAGNPWPWFDLGRCELRAQAPARALYAFRRAAESESGATGARLWAWAARAAQQARDPAALSSARERALEHDPSLATSLRRSIDAAMADQDPEAASEATALLAALDPRQPAPHHRLPVLRPDARPDPRLPAPRPRPPHRRPKP